MAAMTRNESVQSQEQGGCGYRVQGPDPSPLLSQATAEMIRNWNSWDINRFPFRNLVLARGRLTNAAIMLGQTSYFLN